MCEALLKGASDTLSGGVPSASLWSSVSAGIARGIMVNK